MRRSLSPSGSATGSRLLVERRRSRVRTRPSARATYLERSLATIVESVELHVYRGLKHPDGLYEETFTGPGVDGLLGGPGPDDPNAWFRHVHPDDVDAYRAALSYEAYLVTPSIECEYRLVGRDGRTRWMWERTVVRGEHAGVLEVEGLIVDVSARREAADELAATQRALRATLEASRDEAERRSRVDSLTRAANRGHFHELLVAELRRAAREGRSVGVVMLDVDHFKQINDRYGHAAGDTVLVAAAVRIAGAVRDYDCVARWGGDEFVVLLPGVPDEPSLRRVAESIRRAVAGTPVAVGDDLAVAITASAGAACAPPGLWSAEAAVDAADRALYAAKRRGRDRTCAHGDGLAGDLLLEEPEAIHIAEAMARSAGVREGVPDEHCRRVADLSARTALALGLPSSLVFRCRLGGWLHDVGKLAIPDRVLLKPGPLDGDEWPVMRTHPVVGAQLVARIPSLAEAEHAVRHHHERWDGHGYPDALAGEAIPLEARVVATVDAFCAMTESRPYRQPLPDVEAFAELRRCSGRQLDPAVVVALRDAVAGLAAEAGG